VVVLLLIAGAGVLATLPFGPGAMRIGSLNVLWWYGAVVGPLAATVVTIGALLPRRPAPDRGSSATPAA
jgi:hypothetical protein